MVKTIVQLKEDIVALEKDIKMKSVALKKILQENKDVKKAKILKKKINSL